MEYQLINGTVYSRAASTPPVINSVLATKYGIRVPCPVEPGQYSKFEVGTNVKLRLVINDGKSRMTCHGTIDWMEQDQATGQWNVGFGHLSLTDEEFRILEMSFAASARAHLEFGISVRDKATEAVTVTGTDRAREIMRLKAVNFPVSVIELIDENRCDVPFSEFVTTAVREYVKRIRAGAGGS